MLDDQHYIKQHDVQDALGVVAGQAKQLEHDFAISLSTSTRIDSIVVAGMGGSALAASLIPVWPGLSKPFEVVRGYSLPAYVGAHTLVIVSSYSGNTEETVSALADAATRGAEIIVIAAGGKLASAAEAQSYPLFRLPDGLQPRMAVLYNLAALVQLLEQLGLVSKGSVDELRTTSAWLQSHSASWLAHVATADNRAKQIAQELMGKSVVIYGGPKLWPAAYKWKININENAKQIAWCNQLPEFNHNEFSGWTEQPEHKPYAIIDLRSNLENERVQKRFVVTERLLSGKRPKPIVVEAEGETILKQLLWTIALGDFVSVYLALCSGINPTPVDLIEKFKKAMEE